MPINYGRTSFLIPFLLLLLLYFLFLAFLKCKLYQNSKKLLKRNVDKLIAQGKNKLKTKNKRITWKFHNKNSTFSKKIDGKYLITFWGNAVEGLVKEEVYHICRGDCDNHGEGLLNWIRIKLILYPFVFEPRAKLYAVYNIKL